jgi:FMN phosphatase YigB (HAD superfamily)
MRASLSGSGRTTCIPMPGPRWPDSEPGLWVGIAGNQTARAGSLLRGLGLPADMIASSDDWGVTKPDPGFFRKMIEVSPYSPG